MRGAVSTIAVALALGCGSSRSTPPPPSPSTGDAPSATPTAADDLLAHVPEDTEYVFALRGDVPAPLWDRLVGDLGPVLDRLAGGAADELAAGVDDKAEQLELGLVAELAGAPILRPRGVIYELRGVTVLRIEARDPARLVAAVQRAIGGTPTPGANGASTAIASPTDSLYVAATGGQLVVAWGPNPAMTAMADVLAERTPLPARPLARDALDTLAAAHDLAPYAVGFVDFARLGDRLRATPAVLARTGLDVPTTPGCIDAIATLLGAIPRLAIGAGAMTADRIELVAELALDPDDAAALNAAQTPLAGLPIEGSPLIGLALAGTSSGGDPAWRTRLLPVIGQCKPEAAVAMLAEPFSSMRGFVAAIYDGTMHGFLPTAIDGYAAIISDDLDAVMKRARSTGLGTGKAPKDGAPFVKLATRGMTHDVVPSIEVARRGSSLVFASGPTGRAHAEATFATTTPAPMFQLLIDIGRFTHWQPANADPPSAADVDRDRVETGGLLADAGFTAAGKAMIATLAITIGANPRGVVGRVALGLAPPLPADPPPPPPSTAVRQCRRILALGWDTAERALDRLDITADRAELESTYRTSIDTHDFVRKCLDLAPAVRTCMLVGSDPVAGVARCDGVGDLEMPELFSFFGPQPLRDRFGDHDRVPVPDEHAFLIPLYRVWEQPGWLVRDGTGCTAISAYGTMVSAGCTFSDRGGERWLDVTASIPCTTGAAHTCIVQRSMRKDGDAVLVQDGS